MLAVCGHVETPQFLPQHQDEAIRRRTYLRVPLAQPPPEHSPMPQRSGTVWLVQLAHIKTGGRKGPSYLGGNALHKKMRMFAATMNQGHEAAAASTRGPYTVVPITMGDQNLTREEALSNWVSSLLTSSIAVIASEGTVDKQGRLHQDLIAVSADLGVKVAPSRCTEVGFDGVHQAVQAYLCREPSEVEGAAQALPVPAAAEAAEAAASTRGSDEPRGSQEPLPAAAAASAAATASAAPTVAVQEKQSYAGAPAAALPVAAVSAPPLAAPAVAAVGGASTPAADSALASAAAEADFRPDWDAWGPADFQDDIDSMSMMTGEEVLSQVDRDQQDLAAEEDDEATLAEAAEAAGEEEQPPQREEPPLKSPRMDASASASSGAASAAASGTATAAAVLTPRPATASAEAAAASAAAASTPGPARRQFLKSRIIVHKFVNSEKYSLVLSPRETIAEIDRILSARKRAMMDEGQELFGASTLEEAMRALVDNNRMAYTVANAGKRQMYVIFDFQLQHRSRFYAFQDWAQTTEGKHFLWKKDPRSGWWAPLPTTSDAGRFTIPRLAKGMFKNHCDHVFGGQVWFDAINQLGACPPEFVEALNAATNQRLQASFYNKSVFT